MANPLLDRAPPEDFAERRQVFDSQAKIEDFAGLVKIIEKDLGTLDGRHTPQEWRRAPVDIRLQFGWADMNQSLPALSGRLAARIPAVCQRCLEPFELPLLAELDLLLLRAQGDASGDDGQEVWEIEGDTIRPLDLIEEALVMVMPLSAMHAAGERCNALPETIQSTDRETVRPFANLKAQMDEAKR